ncbi:MAG: cytochrome P450, partial [Halioglobus sp.]|nr:cytochrome P450 [Halioglobus sp.]
TLAGDRGQLQQTADEFLAFVIALLDRRRGQADGEPNSVISGLLRERADGKPLADEDIASVLRNWTVGELGSLASGIGIIAHHLASDAGLQLRLRREPQLISAAIEEILRICGPLVYNRRVATRDVVLGGRRISAGERLSVFWVSANRDEAEFPRPAEVRFDRDSQQNLLFGAGIHVCPGAPLARLELRVAVEELLRRSTHISLGDSEPRTAIFPANGWASLELILE